MAWQDETSCKPQANGKTLDGVTADCVEVKTQDHFAHWTAVDGAKCLAFGYDSARPDTANHVNRPCVKNDRATSLAPGNIEADMERGEMIPRVDTRFRDPGLS